MLVEDRQRLLLEKRKSSGIERHCRVPGCTLARVTSGEPVSDEPLIARGQRGIIAERPCGIAAEPPVATSSGPHRLQNAELGRAQEKTRRPDPVLAHVLEDTNRLVVAVDVPEADGPPFDGIEDRRS